MDYEKLLILGCELGYHLLVSNAEIYRVEESIRYLMNAYGVPSGEVFVIPTCIIVSICAPDGRPITRVRRVPGHGTDVRKLEAMNDLCRRLCRDVPDLKTASSLLEEAAAVRANFSFPVQLFAYWLGPMAFCLFFGGTFRDALCSGVSGLTIGLCLSFMERLGTNLFFKTIVGGFFCALTASALTFVGLGQHSNLIITGAIMNLVPGLVITNFMRDIMAGDMLSGLSKLADSLLTAAGIALGTGLALALTRFFWGVV